MVREFRQAAVDEGDGTGLTADEIISRLGLGPHPEGGWFAETFRSAGQGRPAGSAIYYLLRAGERGHWHRVDADEIWHFYAGAALELSLSDDGRSVRHLRLGTDLALGERPQIAVRKTVWQAARSLGAWTLVGCTVAPAFEYAGFELAPPDWKPDASSS